MTLPHKWNRVMLLDQRLAAQWKTPMKIYAAALCAVGAALVSACGGGGDSGTIPAPAPAAPPPAAAMPPSVSPQLDAAALRLYESAAVHASLAASPLVHAVLSDDSVWTNGPCVFGSGSMQASVDGGSPPARGTVLPTGSHIYVVTFANCLVDGLVGTTLNGTASAAYTSTDLNDITALVSVNSMRGTLVAFRSDLYDVTADGSGTWTRVRTSTASTTTYTPTIGSKLINNSTTNVATFGGGSYSSGYGPPPPGSAGSGQQEFNNLEIAISGTSYTLNGSLHSVYGFVGGQASHTGEVRITSNGTLVARVYGEGAFRVEVYSPLVPL